MNEKIIANSVDVASAPDEIKILPLGYVHSQKGNFLVDDESVRQILKHFNERKIDMVIDYEHQTMHNTEAPASGWIKSLHKADDAIVAKVEWTKKATEYLKNKEYKYLSPVVTIKPKDHRVNSIHSVALTNAPAIDGMFAIVNSSSNGQDDLALFLKTLKNLFGLPDDTGTAEVLSYIRELVKSEQSAKSEISSMKSDLEEQEIQDAVMYALKEGKISAHMKKSAENMARNNLELFKEYIANSPQLVPMGKMELKDSSSNKSKYASKVNELLGLTDDEVQKYNR